MTAKKPLHERVIGENFWIDDPEMEIFGLRAKIEQSSLLLRETDGQWREASPSEVFIVPFAIRRALSIDYAEGNSDRIGRIDVPVIGAVTLPFLGIIRPESLTTGNIYDIDDKVAVRNVDIRLGVEAMKSQRSLEIRFDPSLDNGAVVTATSDGQIL